MKHIAFKNKLYAPVTNGLFRSYEQVPDVEVFTSDKSPPFYWEGGKIPFTLWSQIVSFMKWTQQKFKAEAHCTLFYNVETKEWAAWAFPQKTMGMTVVLDNSDERYKEDRKQFNGSWVMAGSVHHHCTAKAFQSSTDSADEISKEGIHVTIGEVLNETVDLHARKVFNGTMVECDMHEFFEYPEWAKHIPVHLRGNLDSSDVLGFGTESKFPEEWKSRISERTFQTASSISGQTGLTEKNPKKTLVGGNPKDWTWRDYAEFQKTNSYAQKATEEKITRHMPQMERVLDDWAIQVSSHHNIHLKDMAKLWLMHSDEAETLTDEQSTMRKSIEAMYKNLTIDKIRIPMLSIVDHMRQLAK